MMIVEWLDIETYFHTLLDLNVHILFEPHTSHLLCFVFPNKQKCSDDNKLQKGSMSLGWRGTNVWCNWALAVNTIIMFWYLTLSCPGQLSDLVSDMMWYIISSEIEPQSLKSNESPQSIFLSSLRMKLWGDWKSWRVHFLVWRKSCIFIIPGFIAIIPR